MDTPQLKEYLLNLFMENDPKHNGFVDHKTFSRIMRQHARLNMTPRQLISVMSEADENEKGQIEYGTFCESSADILHKMYAEEASGDGAGADIDPAQIQFVHGYARSELEETLRTALTSKDPDQSGLCTRIELRSFLPGSILGLTRREVNVLLSELNEDIHGQFVIEEFVETAFDLLVLTGIQEAQHKQRTAKGWEQFFTDLFKRHDVRQSGTLHHTFLRQIIRKAGVGLSNLQIYAVLSEAEEDQSGFVNYLDFSPTLGSIFFSLFSNNIAKQRIAAIKNIALSKADQFVHGMDRDVFTGRLRAALAEHDKTGHGIMNRGEVRSCLDTAGLELSTKEINALMSTLDEEAQGNVSYQQLLPVAYNIMVHLARQELIREITREHS